MGLWGAGAGILVLYVRLLAHIRILFGFLKRPTYLGSLSNATGQAGILVQGACGKSKNPRLWRLRAACLTRTSFSWEAITKTRLPRRTSRSRLGRSIQTPNNANRFLHLLVTRCPNMPEHCH